MDVSSGGKVNRTDSGDKGEEMSQGTGSLKVVSDRMGGEERDKLPAGTYVCS